MNFEDASEGLHCLIVQGNVAHLWTKLGQHDQVSQFHSLWVGHLVAETVRKLSLFNDKHPQIILGALTHDIGKIKIPKQLLTKNEYLTKEELWTVRNGHVEAGWTLLSEYPHLQPAAGGHHTVQRVPFAAECFSWEKLPQWLTFSVLLIGICDMVDRMNRRIIVSDLPKSIEQMRAELQPEHFPMLKGNQEIIDVVLEVVAEQQTSPLAKGGHEDVE